MLTIKRGWVYLANLNPTQATVPGKTRPVLVLQTDLLNVVHPSTIALPITTNVQKEAKYLRVHIPKGQAGLEKDSDILIDQIRAIDNRRLIQTLGEVSQKTLDAVAANLTIVLDLAKGIIIQ